MVLKLTKNQWIILRMYGGGMTRKQIGKALSITPNTVESHIKRCRKKLRASGIYVIDAFDVCHLIERGGLEWVHASGIE